MMVGKKWLGCILQNKYW